MYRYTGEPQIIELASWQVPPSKALDLCIMTDAVEQSKQPGQFMLNSVRLWRYVHEVVPASREHNCVIRWERATMPVIVGMKYINIQSLIELSPEAVRITSGPDEEDLFGVLRNFDGTKTQTFLLYQYLENKYPQMLKGTWQIVNDKADIYIVRFPEDGGDDDDDAEVNDPGPDAGIALPISHSDLMELLR